MPWTTIEGFLRAAQETHPESRIVKMCVQDHTAHSNPHVHVRLQLRLLAGGTDLISCPWTVLGVTNFESLRRCAADHSILMCIHEDKCNAAISKDLLELMWSTCHTLTEDEAGALRLQGDICAVCLECMEAGDEMLCMPCEGTALHAGHWACMQQWLQKASTCPCCRFEMPRANADGATARFDQLIKHSLAAVARVERNGVAHREAATTSTVHISKARVCAGFDTPSPPLPPPAAASPSEHHIATIRLPLSAKPPEERPMQSQTAQHQEVSPPRRTRLSWFRCRGRDAR